MTEDADTDAAPESTSATTTATTTATANGIRATYDETETERRLEFVAGVEDEDSGATATPRGTGTAAIAQNIEGYAMLKVRPTADGDELERYYGFDMALDHAAELLGVSQHDLPIPEAADDMGM
ncbi:hypothetical protein C483_16106 [Natrialba hulunbeirensis JCM 10989]|uniref:Uncharacterized protein n=1 Tax=Natrialba hulunbeirensis JCM 10989 TaxID=1227493 RepID=L9ZRR0_9EURY|nr:hypothetical protein [Natrialba hulunbeirensis]ELY88252.1 hypothetical protein C483_16106 [Natrialba hulunbeirensis JCM 10989]